MDICAIVPVKNFQQAKSRLSVLLRKEQRVELSRFLLQDTLNTLLLCRELAKIVVVSSDPLVKEITQNLGLECLLQSQDKGVNSAVRCADRFLSTKGNWVSITIPCDLPLLLAKDIDDVCQVIPKEGNSVIISPSYKFDGTNLLARSPSNVITDTRYDHDSFRGHLEASIDAGAITKVLLSNRLMIDLDTPEDLELVLLENASSKKSISYLWQMKRNHLHPSFSPASIKPKTKTRTNLDTMDGGGASVAARDL
jgi:2-phospho-L-lactate/phosphoenolpyruvate guanylyltransferase